MSTMFIAIITVIGAVALLGLGLILTGKCKLGCGCKKKDNSCCNDKEESTCCKPTKNESFCCRSKNEYNDDNND